MSSGALGLALLGVVACDSGCSRPKTTKTTPQAESAGKTAEIGPELKKKLEAVLAAKGGDYVPRTKHKSADGSPKYTNRLILQTSPYLLQHAHNPVNWFPWSEEAFEVAKALGRPVFLSVGYSTCHWCHVMEEESFEDEEVAKFMNEHYIPVKVDREERPDVDSIYMSAVNRLVGRGGWPMSVWLTPKREPFFGGTYFPARDGDRGTRKGFLTILGEQSDAYKSDPSGVAARASELAGQIKNAMSSQASSDFVGRSVVARAVGLAASRYDATWGGQRGAPKFPSSFPVRVLLRHHRRSGDRPSLDMAVATLHKMAEGGMYDHVGGGFHRYSTDPRWLVPHFEKMLYDNALLTLAYVEAFQLTKEPDFERVARETLDYVAREMTAPDGGFYSATDADSLTPSGHREEGYYFTWTPAELTALLGPERTRIISAYYAVTAAGNFERRNIFWTPRPREDVAKELGITVAELRSTVAEALPLLHRERNKRPAPLRDDKIQVSWNGLMISAFARAALVFDSERYRDVAHRAASFLLAKLRPGGRLQHSYNVGRATGPAFLEDYAFFSAALLDLFELSSEHSWLENAVSMMNELEKHHADASNGGYFLTANDAEKLIAREKPGHDGAVPSGNSVAALNHLRLSELTTEDKWRVRAETTLRAFARTLNAQPYALDEMLLAVDFQTDVPKEVVIVLPDDSKREDAPGAAELLAVLRATFLPSRVLVVASERALEKKLGKLVPWAADKPAKDGKARAYVCERGSCELPTSDPKVFRKQLTEQVAGR